MKNKFTPGPLEIDETEDTLFIFDAEGRQLLTLEKFHWQHVGYTKMRKFAAGIVAAPEMYEALCMLEFSHDANTQTAFFAKMHKALAKARGGE